MKIYIDLLFALLRFYGHISWLNNQPEAQVVQVVSPAAVYVPAGQSVTVPLIVHA